MIAPEVILGTGHGKSFNFLKKLYNYYQKGKAVDWWALGVITFEFLTGIPPFNAETPQQIFENILNQNISWPSIPEEMSFEAYDLINKFLTIKIEDRLGTTSNF